MDNLLCTRVAAVCCTNGAILVQRGANRHEEENNHEINQIHKTNRIGYGCR